MMFRTILVASLFALTSGTAFAFHCPKEMKAIDAALTKNPKLSAQQMADVKKYRAEGEKLHKAKKHQEALDTLDKAKNILGMKM